MISSDYSAAESNKHAQTYCVPIVLIYCSGHSVALWLKHLVYHGISLFLCAHNS